MSSKYRPGPKDRRTTAHAERLAAKRRTLVRKAQRAAKRRGSQS